MEDASFNIAIVRICYFPKNVYGLTFPDCDSIIYILLCFNHYWWLGSREIAFKSFRVNIDCFDLNSWSAMA
jgi:hypothetical protein